MKALTFHNSAWKARKKKRKKHLYSRFRFFIAYSLAKGKVGWINAANFLSETFDYKRSKINFLWWCVTTHSLSLEKILMMIPNVMITGIGKLEIWLDYISHFLYLVARDLPEMVFLVRLLRPPYPAELRSTLLKGLWCGKILWMANEDALRIPHPLSSLIFLC